jgi:hypothetical protein
MTEASDAVKSDVRRIVDRGFEDMFEALDRLKGAEPADILAALKESGEYDVADQYEDWLGDDAPRDPDTGPAGDPTVPDPGNAPSYDALAEHLRAVEATRKAQP